MKQLAQEKQQNSENGLVIILPDNKYTWKTDVLFQLWIAGVFLEASSFLLKRKTNKLLSGKPKQPESSLFFSEYVAGAFSHNKRIVWTSLCPRVKHTLKRYSCA